MSKIKIFCIAISAILIFPVLTIAQDFDGSKPLICAIVEINECAPGADCLKGIAGDFNFPQFLKINFKDKTLVGKFQNQKMQTSPIEKVESQNGNLILHGSQNGRAWNIVISQTTGEMVGTVAADGFSFTVFGACIAQ